MGWAVVYDETWERHVGYGVPALCDAPGCYAKIDRGLAHVCGGQPFGGEHGCGLHFCEAHLFLKEFDEDVALVCRRCFDGLQSFSPKADRIDWTHWKLIHPSWAEWRSENAEFVRMNLHLLR